jgi:hypothetical protein
MVGSGEQGGAAHAILLAMRDGNACGAERLGEPQQPIGLPNLTGYLAPRRIFASEMTSSSWSRSYRCVILPAHKSAPHRSTD